MNKILVILAGSILLLLLFLGLLRIKNMEEGYEDHHTNWESHSRGERGENPEKHQSIGYAKSNDSTKAYDHSSYYGYYPVYSNYEYPVYYVNDDDDYIFDENGILYYIYNPHLMWNKMMGY